MIDRWASDIFSFNTDIQFRGRSTRHSLSSSSGRLVALTTPSPARVEPSFGAPRGFHIAQKRQQKLIRLNRKTLVSSLVEMSAALLVMGAVALDVRVGRPGKIFGHVPRASRPQNQVPMIGHEAVSEQVDLGMFLRLTEQLDECGIIGVLVKDSAAVVPAIKDVIDPHLRRACGSGHTSTLPEAHPPEKVDVTFFLSRKRWMSPFCSTFFCSTFFCPTFPVPGKGGCHLFFAPFFCHHFFCHKDGRPVWFSAGERQPLGKNCEISVKRGVLRLSHGAHTPRTIAETRQSRRGRWFFDN